MLYLLTICALVLSSALNSQQRPLAGNVSPDTSASTSQSQTSPYEGEGDDASGTGEVDEDVIITDEEDTNDDEGVTS